MTLSPERLKRLVRHRERLERLQEQELAEARRLLAVRHAALEDAHSQRERALDAPIPERGPVEPGELFFSGAFLERAQRDIDARSAAVTHSEADVAEERDELLVRRRERKAMEVLLDKRLEQERIASNRADTKRIDELAVNRWRPPGGQP